MLTIGVTQKRGVLMAKKVILLDDFEENNEIEADAGTTTFAWDGTAYEIDLSTKNRTKFSNQMQQWIAKARRVSGRTASSGTPAKKAPGSTASGYNSEQLAAVREWAGRNGYTVSPKGRVPGEVLHAFEQAQAPKEPGKPAFSG